MDRFTETLHDLTRPGGYLCAGVARMRPGDPPEAVLTGRLHPGDPPGPLDPTLRVRCASITKAATARLACELAAEGTLDLSAPVADALPALDPAITYDALLSHTSGLRDAGGYLTPPGTAPTTLAHPPVTPPCTRFHYANLNCVLLGAALEAVTRTRFDRLLHSHVLAPAGIQGGLNWIGVTDRRPIPLYQRRGDDLTPTTDGPDAAWQADVIWAEGRGHSLGPYHLTRDTCLMSPHAGLRLSLPELARLAAHLGADSPAATLQREVLWRHDGTNGAWCDGLFPAFGRGVTHLSHPDLPSALIGHAGHALGFTGGAWWNPATGIAHAYALTGAADATLPNGDEAFFPEAELRLMRQF